MDSAGWVASRCLTVEPPADSERPVDFQKRGDGSKWLPLGIQTSFLKLNQLKNSNCAFKKLSLVLSHTYSRFLIFFKI